VVLCADIEIYNWDGQMLCPRTDGDASFNSFHAMAVNKWPLLGVFFFSGAYLPQKLTPKSSIETE
jgi:hypothetical protein